MAPTPAGARSPKTIKISADEKRALRANPLVAGMQAGRRGGQVTPAKSAKPSKISGARPGLKIPAAPSRPPVTASEKGKIAAAIAEARSEMAKTVQAEVRKVVMDNAHTATIATTLAELREFIDFRFEQLDKVLEAAAVESDLVAEALAGNADAKKEIADSIPGRRAARKAGNAPTTK